MLEKVYSNKSWLEMANNTTYEVEGVTKIHLIKF